MSGSSPRVLAFVCKIATAGLICGQSHEAGGTAFQVFPDGTQYYANFWGGGDIAGGSVSSGSYDVVAVTWDGTTARLYVNGTAVASSTPLLNTEAVNFTVGGTADWPFVNLIGEVGDVVLLDGVPADIGGFLASLHARWFGTDAFNPTIWGPRCLLWLDPNTTVTTDGGGNVTQWQARIPRPCNLNVTGELVVTGATSLDSGLIATDGGGKLTASKLNLSALPTSSSGLSAGDVWNNAGTLKIV